MGRHVRVPLKNGKIVNAAQVGPDGNTPYAYSDINWPVMKRLGFDKIPRYNDEKGQ